MKKTPLLLEKLDYTTWVYPVGGAKYWTELVGRVVCRVPSHPREILVKVKFEYNSLGIKLEKPEEFNFPLGRLAVATNFLQRLRSHVVAPPTKQEEDDYEVVSAADTLLESSGTSARTPPKGRKFHAMTTSGELLVLDTDSKQIDCFIRAKSPIGFYRLHYNGVAYEYFCPHVARPVTEAKPPAPLGANSRRLEDTSMRVVQASPKSIILSNGKAVESWQLSPTMPEEVHLVYDSQYWHKPKNIKPSQPAYQAAKRLFPSLP